MIKRLIIKQVLYGLLSIGMLVGSFLLGFYISFYKLPGHSYIPDLRVTLSWVDEYLNNLGRGKKETIFSSILLDLKLSSTKVSGNFGGGGGGLTSFRDELVLVNQKGNIFVVNKKEAIQTKIESPDNGYKDYMKIARSTKYSGFSHNSDYIRYNDIHYYTEGNLAYLLLSYTEWLNSKECYCSTVSRVKIPTDTNSLLDVNLNASEWEVMYRTQPCIGLKKQKLALEGHMAGGRMAYLGGNKIALSVGDYNWNGHNAPDSIPYSQKHNNDYGKILEVDLSTHKSKILSMGLRNPQGICLDSNGQIWATDHGPRGGDELNKIISESNYGWPIETFGTDYDGMLWPNTLNPDSTINFSKPIYAWVPSIGISGIAQIKDFNPYWNGDFLVSSLNSMEIYRIRIIEDRVLYSEPIRIGERVRYVHELNNSQIALWTDQGNIKFIEATNRDNIAERIDIFSRYSELNTEQKQKFIVAINNCMTCHSLNNDNHDKSPGLKAVYNAKIASTEYQNYSTGLKSINGSWSKSNLKLFLHSPQKFAPGTSMPNPQISDQKIIDAIIVFLTELNSRKD